MSEPHDRRGGALSGEPEAAAWVPARTRSGRSLPVVRFLLTYAAIIAVGVVLTRFVPFVRDAWMSTASTATSTTIDLNRTSPVIVPDYAMAHRSVIALMIALGALLVSAPVAWVYLHTHRLRFDVSLVQSVIILPVVIAGIVVVVKNSVALAFSLAGIVAAVRFRNTLKDPKDAVYIFLAIGIGLAAGVQALDIALVVSMVVNIVVLVLWRYQIGAVTSSRASGDMLSIGDPSLHMAESPRGRDAIKWRVSREGNGAAMDGILLVHARNAEDARRAVELSVGQVASRWQMVENFRRRNGVTTFAVMLELDSKKGDPLALLADLDERWHLQVDAAEYIPFKLAAKAKAKSE